jgi:hypothetical protein
MDITTGSNQQAKTGPLSLTLHLWMCSNKVRSIPCWFVYPKRLGCCCSICGGETDRVPTIVPIRRRSIFFLVDILTLEEFWCMSVLYTLYSDGKYINGQNHTEVLKKDYLLLTLSEGYHILCIDPSPGWRYHNYVRHSASSSSTPSLFSGKSINLICSLNQSSITEEISNLEVWKELNLATDIQCIGN